MVPLSAPPVEARRRSDARRNHGAILAAACRLLDQAADAANDAGGVTIDAIAAAAGVGKGTIFRSFVDRAGLLRAVLGVRIAALVQQIEQGPPPLGPAASPHERLAAVMLAMLDFKLAHRGLFRALEQEAGAPDRTRLQDTPHYRWAHRLLRDLLAQAAAPGQPVPCDAGFRAHALLSLIRIDLIEHLLDQSGHTTARLRHDLLSHLRLVDLS